MTPDRGPRAGRVLRVPPEYAARFWARVDRRAPDECWLWLGAGRLGAYGGATIGAIRRGPLAAHRIAYALTHGEVPAGMSVCHACDNPLCCNPAHLWLGDHRDNVCDMVAKGRHVVTRALLCECGAVGSRGWAARTCLECSAKRARQLQRRRHLPARIAVEREQQRRFERLRDALPPTLVLLATAVGVRAARLIARNIGLYGLRREPLSALALREGVSRERVRQIVVRGLRRMGLNGHSFYSTKAA